MSTDTTTPAQERARPAATMRRVLLCRVAPRVMSRLRGTEEDVQEAAGAALARGLDVVRTELDKPGAGHGKTFASDQEEYAEGSRPLAVSVSQPLIGAVAKVALDQFGGDTRAAAGWLLARGVGIPMALPGAHPAKPILKAPPEPKAAPAQQPASPLVRLPGAGPTSLPTAEPQPAKQPRQPRARPQTSGTAEVDAPTGPELRASREELGISQRDLAVAAGLSRGLVAEVERGRRANALTRLRLAETMRSIARSR